MKTLIILCLGLLALFTGGCSLIFFATALVQNSDAYLRVSSTWPVWSLGFGIATFAMLAARTAQRLKSDAPTASPERAARMTLLTILIACTAFPLGGLAPMILANISQPVLADPLVWVSANLTAALTAYATRAAFALPAVPQKSINTDPAP